MAQRCLPTASRGNQFTWLASLAGSAAVMVIAAVRSGSLLVRSRTCTQALRLNWTLSVAERGHSANGGHQVSAEQSGDPETRDEGFTLSTPVPAPLLGLGQSAPTACLGYSARTHPSPLVVPSARPSRSVAFQAARFVGGARHFQSRKRSPSGRSTRCRASRRSMGAKLQQGPRAETPMIVFDPSRLPQRIQLGLWASSHIGVQQGRESKSLTDRRRSGRSAGVLGKFKYFK
jgi:hypothetical protein